MYIVKIISIVAFLILLVVIFFYCRVQENMTNMEASSILPVLYDSSLTNKNKITDLLGIAVDDISYNKILNAENKDADVVISAIKEYIGASVTFNTPNRSDNKTSPPLASVSTTSSTPAPSNATTTKPTTLKIEQIPFKDRI